MRLTALRAGGLVRALTGVCGTRKTWAVLGYRAVHSAQIDVARSRSPQ